MLHNRCVAAHLLSRFTAKQLVHRYAEGLTLDIPAGDVNSRNRTHDNRTAEVNRAVQVLTDVFCIERIFPDQVRCKLPDRIRGRTQKSPVSCLTQTGDACIGIDLNK